MLYSTAVFWCALFRFLVHPKEVFGYNPNSGRSCKDNREEFGFALVGHHFNSVHADNFARCFFECSLVERCQNVTFLWNEKECQMKNETKDKKEKRLCGKPSCYLYGEQRSRFVHSAFCFRQRTRLDGRLTSNQMILQRIYGQSFNWLTPLYWYFYLPVHDIHNCLNDG